MSLKYYLLLLQLVSVLQNENNVSSSQSTMSTMINDNENELLNDPLLKLISYSESIVEAKMGIELRQITSLFIGTPFQEIKVKLSTSICGVWVVNHETFGHGFKYSNSDSFTDFGYPGKVDYAKGEMCSEVIQFANLITEKKVPMLLVNETSIPGKIDAELDGLLGFGYKCRSQSKGNVNLIQMLIENKSAKYTDMFVFFFDSIHNGGMFTVGTIPENINVFNKKYWDAEVDKNNNNGHWQIKFYSLYFDDNYLIPINKPISVGIGGCMFSVTKEIFELIYERYFTEYVKRGECQLVKEVVWEIYCDEKLDVSNFTKFSLVFGKWNWKLYPTKLFRTLTKNGKNKQWFTVVYYPEYNQFYLSQLMFEGKTGVIYDRAENMLSFYIENSEK